MQKFEFPTNIKQIGSISAGCKIYMEDYVCSYLQQYAESWGYQESLAILLGRQLVIDGQKVLFISGTVQGKYTKNENGIETFTEETWDYVDEQISTYFKELEVVGWVQSQPGYGVFLNANYAKYHFDIFKRSYQVMFVIDPVEKINAFFAKDSEKKELIETKGYFVYYDKNETMHEYMLDNKVVQDKMPSQLDDEIEEEEVITKAVEGDTIRERGGNIKTLRPKPVKSSVAQRRLLNMLVSVSSVLFLICFIMGAGLMQNEDRITKLEADLNDISESYAAVVNSIKSGNTEAVFAAQPDIVKDIIEPVERIDTDSEPASIINEDGNKLLEEVTEPITEVDNSVTEATEETVQSVTPSEVTTTIASTETSNSVTRSIPETYTVEVGDNLLYISLQIYGTTGMVEQIMAYNNLSNADKIVAGKKLKLPPVAD